MLRALKVKIHSLQVMALKHYKKTLFLTLALYLLSFVFLPQLKILTSIDDLTDKNFKSYPSLKLLKENFASSNGMSLFLTADKNFTKADLCAINKELREVKLHFRGLDFILTSLDLKELKYDGRRFHFEPYFNINCHTKSDYNKDLAPIFEKVQQETPWSDIIVSKNSFDFMISFYFSESENLQNGSLNIKDVERLKNIWDEFSIKHKNLRAHWIGDGIFQYYLRKGYDKIIILNLLAIILTLLLFKFFLGTYKSGLLYIISVSISSSIVFGGMALTNSPMDILSNSISIMLFISCIEDFIFLSHIRSQSSNWRLPFKKILTPSFLTSFTTFIGFGSLYFTDLDIIKRFGFWAAVGAIVEWLVMFYFIPALLKQFPTLQNWVEPEICKKRFSHLSKLGSLKLSKVISLILLLTIPISLFGANKIRVKDSPQDIFRTSHPGQIDLKYVEETRGWKSSMSLIFKDRDNKNFNQSVLKSYKESGLTVAIEDPYRIEKHLSSKLEKKGLDKLIIDKWRDSFFGKKYYSKNSNELRALLYLDNIELNNTLRLEAFNKTLCPNNECFLAGSLVSYAEFGSKILNSLFSSFLISLLLVGLVILLLSFSFKLNFKNTLSLIAASFWGPMTLICVFYLFGVSITYVTSLIASIMVGLAGDNAIQFLYRKNNIYENAKFYQGSTLFITFCMIAISSSFFISDFIQLQKLGAFMVLGFVFNYIGDVFILKALNK